MGTSPFLTKLNDVNYRDEKFCTKVKSVSTESNTVCVISLD